MKKFSNITGQKVASEPKIETKVDESKIIKSKMISLMNQFLSIRFHGSNDYRLMGGGTKIEGQDMLAEAILDLLSDKSIKETTKILESLKSEIGDWQVIDEKIEQINKDRVSISNKNRIVSLMEKYSSDSETLLMVAEKSATKLTNKKTLQDYISVINESQLSETTRKSLTIIYTNRLNQI